MSQVISVGLLRYYTLVAFLLVTWNHELVHCATVVTKTNAEESHAPIPETIRANVPISSPYISATTSTGKGANSLSTNAITKESTSAPTTQPITAVTAAVINTTTTPVTPTIIIETNARSVDKDGDATTIALYAETSTASTEAAILGFDDDNECVEKDKNGDTMTQAAFLNYLTHDCRYDKLTMPKVNEPLLVKVMMDIQHIEAAEHMQFKMHMLLQYRYVDRRLDYTKNSPNRTVMVGEELLRNKIWIPHIVIANEKESNVMGNAAKDVYVQISPSGEVIFSHRMQATVYCWMDLKKFPFDEQTCEVILRSWTYNMSYMILQWEDYDPVQVAHQLHLTEYAFKNSSVYATSHNESFKHGAFVGSYSSLVFKFEIEREIGFYILDYFIPSIMLVSISWVTFWLQADAAPARVTLGTATMLAFITLAAGQSRSLPKVSYIKASEIWFIACALFIFGSMVEFAFVNIIWRRRSNVELKKVNSKYIFKSTLTPRLARRDLQRSNSMRNLQKSHSCSSLEGGGSIGSANNLGKSNTIPAFNNYLTVHSFPSQMNIPTITTQSVDDLMPPDKSNETIADSITIQVPETPTTPPPAHSWTTMTPQQISQWIDKRSRVAFPAAFLVFNVFYWSFVYAL